MSEIPTYEGEIDDLTDDHEDGEDDLDLQLGQATHHHSGHESHPVHRQASENQLPREPGSATSTEQAPVSTDETTSNSTTNSAPPAANPTNPNNPNSGANPEATHPQEAPKAVYAARITKELEEREKAGLENRYGKGPLERIRRIVDDKLRDKSYGTAVKIAGKIVLGGGAAIAAGSVTGGLGLIAAPILFSFGTRAAIDGGLEAVQHLYDTSKGKKSHRLNLRSASLDLLIERDNLKRLEEKEKTPEEMANFPDEVERLVNEIAAKEQLVIQADNEYQKWESKWRMARAIAGFAGTLIAGYLHGIPLGTQNYDGDAAHAVRLNQQGFNFIYNSSKEWSQAGVEKTIHYATRAVGHTMGSGGGLGVRLIGSVGVGTALLGLFYETVMQCKNAAKASKEYNPDQPNFKSIIQEVKPAAAQPAPTEQPAEPARLEVPPMVSDERAEVAEVEPATVEPVVPEAPKPPPRLTQRDLDNQRNKIETHEGIIKRFKLLPPTKSRKELIEHHQKLLEQAQKDFTQMKEEFKKQQEEDKKAPKQPETPKIPIEVPPGKERQHAQFLRDQIEALNRRKRSLASKAQRTPEEEKEIKDIDKARQDLYNEIDQVRALYDQRQAEAAENPPETEPVAAQIAKEEPTVEAIEEEPLEIDLGPETEVIPPEAAEAPTIQDEFSVRELDPAESQGIFDKLQLKDIEFRGRKLTKEILQSNDLLPTHEITLNGKKVWSSSKTFEFADRIAGLAYFERDSVVEAAPYMTSSSQGIFRFYPGFVVEGGKPEEEVISVFSKGYGEESLSLPIALQAALGKTDLGATNVSDEDAALIVLGTTNKYTDEAEAIIEGGKFSEVDKAKKVIEGIDPIHFDHLEKEPAQITPVRYEDLPDFSKVIHEWTRKNDPTYGEIDYQSFNSKDGNIRYLFCTDEQGRVWIGAIEYLKSPINSRGLRQQWIDAGVLTTPAYEYPAQLVDQNHRTYANKAIQKGEYVDSYHNFLNFLPIIQDYNKTT